MADQNFREIQLSGKQLFFLFMASVVVAVGVFLLGVSVGRGVDVNAEGPAVDVGRTAEILPDGEVPGPTVITPDDQRYHENLQGTTTPPAERAPAPAPAERLDGPEVIDEPVPAAQPAAAAPPVPAPAPPAATPKPATTASTTATPPAAAATAKPTTAKPAAAQAGGSWLVQVAAFRSRENADRQARELSALGFPASVSVGGGLFRVRVGPYGQRSDADRTAARLRAERGLTPSVTR